MLEIIAGDRPGLLSEIGKVFLAEQIDVVTAKIMTIGERAEDVFYVTDAHGRALTPEAAPQLQERLAQTLDRRDADQVLNPRLELLQPVPVRASAQRCSPGQRRLRPCRTFRCRSASRSTRRRSSSARR